MRVSAGNAMSGTNLAGGGVALTAGSVATGSGGGMYAD